MTRHEIEAALAAVGIEEARTEAMILFCHYSGMSRAAALAEREADCAAPALAAAVRRREGREPLAYILGEAWFFEECYEVSPACLIPRPETEMLVEYAIAHLPQGGLFADLCTGSGCIAVSTLAHRSDCRAQAYDLSPDALALAARNAQKNGVAERICFFEKDLLTDALSAGATYDMILSNPPYVTQDEMKALAPELFFEPRMSLEGGADGLIFYTRFLQAYTDRLTEDGCFVFEIGAEQGAALLTLAAQSGLSCRIEKDAAGRDRMAVVSKRTAQNA